MTTSSTPGEPGHSEPGPPEQGASEQGRGPGSRAEGAAAERIRLRELASFLRSRRERITPEQVGLPPGTRRRTPGLRREEVAQLAGVGVTWYTWLEQGRPINASEQVLDSIARTLMLDPQERLHFLTLAGTQAQTIEFECRALSPSVQVLLDKLDPFPAWVSNPRQDILAFNCTFGRLVDDIDAMPFEDRNVLWLMFTHPGWRDAVVDWEDAVRYLVARYRASMAEHVAEPAWKQLVKRLHHASPEFSEVWARHEVAGAEDRTKVLMHREVGLLRLDYSNMWFGPGLCKRMITYTPADDETLAKLYRIHESLLAVREAIA